MRLHNLEDEVIVFVDQHVVMQFAFKRGMALLDNRRAYPFCRAGGQAKFGKFVHRAATAIANAADNISEYSGRQVDNAFPALSDHIETVIAR